MDNSLDSLDGPARKRPPKKKDPMDDSLSGSGARIPRPNSRHCPPPGMRGSITLNEDDLDGSNYDNLLDDRKPPRRTLSSELNSSLVIGGSNWKSMETVHKRVEDFGDSDSFMGDSFAGSSFASTQDSWVGDEIERPPPSNFTALDDEPGGLDPKMTSPIQSRKTTPRRTYSKQSKRMPKKVDPLSAITEDGDGDGDEL